jgi:CelD/BcsL family acetyltransferase involved in cellulose biosynthesis
VAALVTFQDGKVRRFYTTWFDPQWSRHSPGVALLFEATRLSLAEGLTCDYMTGEQDYKLRLATGAVPLYRASGAIRHSCFRVVESELDTVS